MAEAKRLLVEATCCFMLTFLQCTLIFESIKLQTDRFKISISVCQLKVTLGKTRKVPGMLNPIMSAKCDRIQPTLIENFADAVCDRCGYL